jgi:hypothetical protein
MAAQVGRGTAALVFSLDGSLAGIFTERDYLKSTDKADAEANDPLT